MNANEIWIALFRIIPVDLHDTLSLGLTTGAEIVMQRIVRLDPEFMIIRGRLAGTTDPGRIVMVPYNQLTFVAITRPLKDLEVEAIFGASAPMVGVEMPIVAQQPAEPAPGGADKPGEPAAAATPAKPEPPNKKALLEKLRGQLKGN